MLPEKCFSRSLTRLNLLTLTLIFFVAGYKPAFSKDLTHRLGVGVRQIDNGSAVMAQYHVNRDYSWIGHLGFNTLDGNSYNELALALRRNLLFESNLNAFASVRLSQRNQNMGGGSQTGFGIALLGGVEFFFSELENLGFQTEAGLELGSFDSSSYLRTTGGPFTSVGVVFYF
ncbi:MAG: hypothetical protein N2578_04495 [Bdellovibrionaceae bacterium]|jgi:hypothetical protein|nr:hypothetical protein [Pseudobdellovibrionaceae bacterium]